MKLSMGSPGKTPSSSSIHLPVLACSPPSLDLGCLVLAASTLG